MLATHAFFLWSVRGRIWRADPDFTVFYTAGKILRAGLTTHLYEAGTQQAVQLEFASDADIRRGPLPYIHPPFEALLFVPLTYLHYTSAFVLWNLLNLGLLVAVNVLLRDTVACLKGVSLWDLVAACLAFFPIFANFHQGQDAILLLWLVLLGFRALDRQADFMAGCWLGLGMFKYHLILPLALILIVWRGRKLAAGFAVVVALLAAISVGMIGWQEAMQYPVYVLRVILQPGFGGIPPRQLPNLLGLLAGWPVVGGLAWMVKLTVIAGSVGLLWMVASLRSRLHDARFRRLGFGCAVIASLLVGYSTNTYDLSLLVIPLAFVADYCVQKCRDQAQAWKRLILPAAPLLISPAWFFLWLRWERIHLLAVFLLWWLFAVWKEVARVRPASENARA